VYGSETTRATRRLTTGFSVAKHHIKFEDWYANPAGDRYQFSRTPFYKDVIRTSIAKQVGFDTSMRYGEDHDFSRRLKQSGLILKHVHINEDMYYYYAPKMMSISENNKRYGIK
jgi:hypothetical protein